MITWLKDYINTFVQLGSVQRMSYHTCTARLAWRNGEENRLTVKLTVLLAWMLLAEWATKQSKASYSSEPVFAVVDLERVRFT